MKTIEIVGALTAGLGLGWLIQRRKPAPGKAAKQATRAPAGAAITIPPGLPISKWPQDAAGRSAAVLAAVREGRGSYRLASIQTSAGKNRIARVRVFSAPLMVDGVTVNAHMAAQQAIADHYGLLLFTPKLADMKNVQATTRLTPLAQTWYKDGTMGLTSRMLDYHQLLQAAKAKAEYDSGKGILSNAGKYWVLSSGLWQSGNARKSANYGWYNGSSLLQPLGLAHNLAHSDYSQVIELWSPDVEVSNDGGMTWRAEDGRKLLTSTAPGDYSLVSYERLPGYRHPGIPLANV